MLSIPQYLIECSVCLLFFYLFYLLVLKRETFFQLNRGYLLITPLIALAIPLLDIELTRSAASRAALPSDPVQTYIYPALSEVEQVERMIWEPVAHPPAPWLELSLGEILLVVYGIGLSWMLVQLTLRLLRLWRWIESGKREKQAGFTLVRMPADFPAASFFGYIFWNRKINEETDRMMLAHELVHLRQWHSADILLMELLVVLFWFHPLVYAYRRSLRDAHEYIADRYVAGREGSAYEYARLLVARSRSENHPRIVNTFDRNTKKRLLMLSRNPSPRWKSWKYALLMPLAGSLLTLFSFNLADALPVGHSVEDLSYYLENLSQKEVMAIGPLSADRYELRWGENRCDCFVDQVKNYLHCENLTFRRRELKRLARKGKGFEILKNGEPIPVEELTVISRRALKLQRGESQFDFQGRFDSDSKLWKRLQEGDALRMTFKAGEQNWFKFNVTVNDKQRSFDYGYQVNFGAIRSAIDMLQHSGIKYLSFDQYRKMLDEEIAITKNEGEEVGIRSVRARLGYPGRQLRHLNQRSDQALARLRELEIARLADAGARLDLQLQTTDGREMDLTFKIRKPSGPVNHAALARIRWGRKEAILNHSHHRGFHLSLERARQMAESPIRMTVAGQEREIVSARIKTSDAQHQPGSNRLWREVSGKQLGHALKEILRKARPGDWIGLYQVTSAEGFQTSFNILIKSEIDPRQLYASPSAARFLREGNRITLGNLPDLDLRKLAALQFRKGRRAVFKLDGERLSRETHDAVGARRITPWDVARHLDSEALETVILLLPGDHELRGMPVIKLKGEVLVRTKAPKAIHQMMKARTEGRR